MRFALPIFLATCLCASGQGLIGLHVVREPFTFVKFPDLHATSNGLFIGNFTTNINWILSNRVSLNIVGAFGNGDIWTQNTNDDPTSAGALGVVTNGFNSLKSNGVQVVLHPGNHDCDVASNYPNMKWNDVFGLAFYTNQPGFAGTRLTNDSRSVVMLFTNSGVLVCVATEPNLNGDLGDWIYQNFYGNTFSSSNVCRAAYAPYSAWMLSVFRQYSNHNAVGMSHFILTSQTNLNIFDYRNAGTPYIGPNVEIWDDCGKYPANVQGFLCGHVRGSSIGAPFSAHMNIRSLDGHNVDISCFNDQSSTNHGAYDRLYTWFPDSGMIHAYTVDTGSGIWLTNNQNGGTFTDKREWDYWTPFPKTF